MYISPVFSYRVKYVYIYIYIYIYIYSILRLVFQNTIKYSEKVGLQVECNWTINRKGPKQVNYNIYIYI